MTKNIFVPDVSNNQEAARKDSKSEISPNLPNYMLPPTDPLFTGVSFLMGFAVGVVVFYVFYMHIVASVVGGIMIGTVNIFLRQYSAVANRKMKLRAQFLDMLESMSVSMRAGNPLAKALVNAREDLILTYSADSDIIVELDAILQKFNSAIPLSEGFANFAERSGLEDVASFATVYATIEGKSGRADEIIHETQRIISDKMTIEMEIATMMTSAKNEVNTMLFMPLCILLVISYAGAGFMDAIYTTVAGRIVATVGLAIYGLSYLLAQKFSNITL